MKNLIFFLVLFSSNAYCFDIYQYIKWKNYTDSNGNLISNSNQFQNYLKQQNIKPIDVVYHNRFLTNGIPDAQKIKIIAEKASKYPNIPISFDIEVGDRFQPKTVLPTIQKTLSLYHKFGGKAPVGVYGVLPQGLPRTEIVDNEKRQKFINLNQAYETVASQVNFLNPVIYNFNIRDFNDWKNRVDLQISEAKKYAKKYNLKIIPYFSITYITKEKRGEKIIEPLTEQEASKRLNYIKSKGVDGIIIWDTNIGTLADSSAPIFNSQHGSSKALLNFSRSN
ncbi:hypothetical protein [Acinetobacter sp. ANC 3813]|uniref:hypothetical protein n=1 Tax=Acinetobacter sp. ANC 3813 TaxID=1977873 RepID=UPI000A33D336|nr:hypothetical protein [Acinetobacter sp. ANC 3813]OTG88643.1 hypothetical protein B9T34_14945 [Acinetobacter sp. ANC 3813]